MSEMKMSDWLMDEYTSPTDLEYATESTRKLIGDIAKYIVKIETENEAAYKKYRSIELANKEMSRNDHVHFGELMEERDQLRTQLAKAKDATQKLVSKVTQYAESGCIDAYYIQDDENCLDAEVERARQTLEDLNGKEE